MHMSKFFFAVSLGFFNVLFRLIILVGPQLSVISHLDLVSLINLHSLSQLLNRVGEFWATIYILLFCVCQLSLIFMSFRFLDMFSLRRVLNISAILFSLLSLSLFGW